MRLAVLLSLGSSQEHDGGSLCTQARPWKWGRSSLQPISAVLEIYCPAKSETWPHATGPKSALSSANPRSRARGLQPEVLMSSVQLLKGDTRIKSGYDGMGAFTPAA